MSKYAMWISKQNFNNLKLVKKQDSEISFSLPRYKEHLENIMQAIKDNDDKNLQNYLTYQMEYSITLTQLSRTYYDPSMPAYNHMTTPPEYFIQARPLLEALFFEFPDDFIEIIEAIIQSNNKKCYQTFISSFKKTSLPAAIFNWDTETATKVDTAIQTLHHYALVLKKNGSPKAALAEGVVKDLSSQMEKQKTIVASPCHLQNEDQNENIEYKNMLDTLKFKTVFKKTLHSQDKELNKYTGWARLINVVTILFSLCTINLIKWATTGKFLFFNEVTTKNLVSDIDRQMHLRR